jgi:hypothetical protein
MGNYTGGPYICDKRTENVRVAEPKVKLEGLK